MIRFNVSTEYKLGSKSIRWDHRGTDLWFNTPKKLSTNNMFPGFSQMTNYLQTTEEETARQHFQEDWSLNLPLSLPPSAPAPPAPVTIHPSASFGWRPCARLTPTLFTGEGDGAQERVLRHEPAQAPHAPQAGCRVCTPGHAPVSTCLADLPSAELPESWKRVSG